MTDLTTLPIPELERLVAASIQPGDAEYAHACAAELARRALHRAADLRPGPCWARCPHCGGDELVAPSVVTVNEGIDVGQPDLESVICIECGAEEVDVAWGAR